MDTREAVIQSAFNDLNAGIYSNQRVAAKANNIPASTYRDRMNGRTNSQLSHQLQATTSTRKRKRIQIDQNERFVNIDHIKGAMDEAAAEEAVSLMRLF